MTRTKTSTHEQCRRESSERGGASSGSSQRDKACILCGTRETPLWRANDIDGVKNVCNACGVRQNRLKRARRADDAARQSSSDLGRLQLLALNSSTSYTSPTKRAASAHLDRVLPRMGTTPMSRAWSLGQLGDPDLGDWGPYFDPHASHSDPLGFYSTQPLAATPSLEDTAVHGAMLPHAGAEVEPASGDLDLDPLDPRFLARIHDPHQG